jgi:hypothetical protein
VEDNKESGQVLLQEFFAGTAEAQHHSINPPPQAPVQLAWEPLTMAEVKDAIFRVKLYKAPGVGGIPAIAWKELWPVVGKWIYLLFETSLRAGIIPQSWKRARILPLRKTDKPDYTVAKAFRPISLLPTLAKALESGGRRETRLSSRDLLPLT